MEKAEEQDQPESVGELEQRDGAWARSKIRERAAKGANKGMRLGSKRSLGSKDVNPLKKFKFELIQDGWGCLTMEE